MTSQLRYHQDIQYDLYSYQAGSSRLAPESSLDPQSLDRIHPAQCSGENCSVPWQLHTIAGIGWMKRRARRA